MFDLVFTSPPYYDLEEYRSRTNGLVGQSLEKPLSLQEWLNNFLFPLVAKAWSFVKPGGHYILYMNDYATKKAGASLRNVVPVSFVQDTVSYMLDTLDHCQFKGVISQTNSIEQKKSIKAQPFWIFNKCS